MKQIVIIFLLITRNWAVGSCDEQKTSRARAGLSLTIFLYLLIFTWGVITFVASFFEPSQIKGNMYFATMMFLLNAFCFILVIYLPIYFKKKYPHSLILLVGEMEGLASVVNKGANHLYAFLFAFGWLPIAYIGIEFAR